MQSTQSAGKNLFDTKRGKHTIGNRRKETCMQPQEPETMRDFLVTQVNPLPVWINTKIIFTNKTNNVLTSCCTTLSKNPTMKTKVTKKPHSPPFKSRSLFFLDSLCSQ